MLRFSICRRTIGLCASVVLIMAMLAGCGVVGPGAPSRAKPQIGKASWYGKKYHGCKTASGEVFDMYKLTAAHNKIKLGTYVRVTNLENGKSVVVKVNDRGPFVRGRIIDLSYGAARKISMIKDGVVNVKVEIVR